MSKLPTPQEWGCKQLLYKEVVDILVRHFISSNIPCMPINGAYYYQTDQFNQIPPSRLFAIDFIVQEDDFDVVIDSFERVQECIKLLDLDHKSVLSYTLGKYDIKVDIYKKVLCPGGGVVESEKLFSRGRKCGLAGVVLPAPEDVILLLFCKQFHYSEILLDSALFAKSALLFSDHTFSWERFRGYAGEYNLVKYAVYLILLYNRHEKENVSVPGHSIQALILATPFLQLIYKITPQFLRKLFFKVPFVPHPTRYLLHKLFRKITQQIFNRLKNGYAALLKRAAKKVIIEAENASIQNFSQSILENAKCYTLDTSFSEQFIISTTTGLWILIKDRVQQIAIGACYGITRIKNRWYSSQRVGNYSRIISFRVNFTSDIPLMVDVRIEYTGLSLNIHQIDSFDNELFFIETLKNRIGYIDIKGKRKWVYPNRDMKSNTPAQDNNHFNSLYITKDYVYVLAHNGWLKPKRNSQIYVLHKSNYRNHAILEIDSQEAHNIIFYEDELIYCDSKGGKLIWGKKDIFTDEKYFLRGLAISKENIIIGGSEILERSKRTFSDGVIWFLDHNGSIKESIALPKIGQIHEIRSFDHDYGLSEVWRNEQ